MITIYCLIDPRNNMPFYVGATKLVLKNRLNGHINDARKPHRYFNGGCSPKNKLIIELLSLKLKPIICPLFNCHIQAANDYEKFYYDMFISQGFTLLQQSHSFIYTQVTTKVLSQVAEYHANKNKLEILRFF